MHVLLGGFFFMKKCMEMINSKIQERVTSLKETSDSTTEVHSRLLAGTDF